MFRIGQGYDIHRFEDHLSYSGFKLGGVDIPYERKLMAHSDGDVVYHAVCDALLGACALGDIGQHFPDTDPAYKDCDSRDLLRKVMALVKRQGYEPVNIDMTILAQAPKMAPHTPLMREHLSTDLGLSVNDISIKATTNEGLDAIGNRLGIAVYAIVLIKKSQT